MLQVHITGLPNFVGYEIQGGQTLKGEKQTAALPAYLKYISSLGLSGVVARFSIYLHI